MYDSVGAGSESFGKDGRKGNGGWERGAVGLREKGWQDVGALLASGKADDDVEEESKQPGAKRRRVSGEDEAKVKKLGQQVRSEAVNAKGEKKVFDGLCVFINGSTAPLVGDHRLKQLLAENGARVSIALGRRTVTHVILGRPNGGAGGGGAGGGLAANKIQKEILRVGGKGVKYVGVEW